MAIGTRIGPQASIKAVPMTTAGASTRTRLQTATKPLVGVGERPEIDTRVGSIEPDDAPDDWDVPELEVPDEDDEDPSGEKPDRRRTQHIRPAIRFFAQGGGVGFSVRKIHPALGGSALERHHIETHNQRMNDYAVGLAAIEELRDTLTAPSLDRAWDRLPWLAQVDLADRLRLSGDALVEDRTAGTKTKVNQLSADRALPLGIAGSTVPLEFLTWRGAATTQTIPHVLTALRARGIEEGSPLVISRVARSAERIAALHLAPEQFTHGTDTKALVLWLATALRSPADIHLFQARFHRGVHDPDGLLTELAARLMRLEPALTGPAYARRGIAVLRHCVVRGFAS